MNEILENWLFDNFIEYEKQAINTYVTDLGVMQLLPYAESLTSVEGELNLNLSYDVCEDILDGEVEYFIFQFGEGFFYTPINRITNVQLNDLRYIGNYSGYLPKDESSRVFAGLHGRYELMNGTKDYKDWCKKAKFLKFNSLGICEKNTLAGTLPFQMACDKAGLKAIIGYTAEVEDAKGERYDVKLFCINHEGWKNLLHVNKIINIDQEGYIEEKQIMPFLNGLAVVVFPGKHVTKPMLVQYKRNATKAFFQITTNEFQSESRDKRMLLSMKKYLNEWTDIMDPILINDAYCLEYEDVHVKSILNKQGNTKFTYATEDHFFKSFEDCAVELEEMFDPEDGRYFDLFNNGLQGLKWLNENCQYKIETKKLFLPKYEMTEKEIKLYGDTTSMFDALIGEGLDRKFPNTHSEEENMLWERIAKEREVIVAGGFIDYFLILWDIINWCKKENIQTGPGRGSAAGSLISYLLGIVKIDPMRFDLLFERFLNESRIKSELPDIDVDFASDRRDDVIEYMRQRYGYDYVCRVGTYGTLQMRGVVKELARAYNYNGEYNMNFITKLIDENESWGALFQSGIQNRALRNFIEDNPEIINDSKAILNAIKSTSMHACATIIVPKLQDDKGNDLSIYEQIPVRMEDEMLVSEWEGDIMAEAGFLKEDILSTKQMAKIGRIFDLVKEHTGTQLDMEEIPLDDPEVFELFQQGLNQDVFHFGSTGLTTYHKMVKPKNINELIATIALYRPGAMASNAHLDYVKLKKGEIEPEYDYMLKEVTEDTFGLYIYQEQIMKAVQVLGGFTLTEADGVRKAMGKKIKEKMDGYKVQFVKNAIEKGCPEEEAHKIWNKMEVFAGYGFNKSHAAAYSVIGYYCNWLKLHHPLEFWTVAFEFAKEEKIQDFVGEVHKLGDIEIVSPDINKSEISFKSDVKTNRIYWNLSSIKQVGPVASEEIIKERQVRGKYFSMEEFVERTEGKGVNKRTVEHLILSGCFDEMYRVKKASERLNAIKDYFSLRPKDEIPKIYLDNEGVEHFWSIKQSEISKLSNLDYHKLITQSIFQPYHTQYISCEEMMQMKAPDKKGPTHVIAGMIQEIIVRKTKKDKREYAVIQVIQDDCSAFIRVWPQQLENENGDPRLFDIQSLVKNQEAKLVIFRGEVCFNSFTNGNEMIVNDRIDGPLIQAF